ncbi:N-acetyl-gamma-glutamyl-phosphate reductase [Mesoterricola sediminis]|uniref:N-acetyl-gamma-glutamyl-phosphate reductase n=1 Tax=Mesoterricola sediminis TaxID=2927980 RepID=A0AA48GX72_9BACT|nr:N-acetyl-gamma-glutamyl-phosphate reductase [Mesoterricola sediminis]BDU77924.1 N-acetyl-gamma-glutamyl-phosphate/N-acetyl-gamma- aminoadipyl-phosphate reductase [Mesoterricola sediminis]
MKLDVAILGASGYGGGELLRWLSGHPATASLRGTSRHAGRAFGDVHPNLRGIVEGRLEETIAWDRFGAAGQPVVFSALPHGELTALLPSLEAAWAAAGIAEQVVLLDLSTDFRGAEHRDRFAYGLPEWNREALRGARRIACAGCFATALQLALLPLRGLDVGWMAATGATGSSGSGASPSEGTHHPLRAQDFRAYKPLVHQHMAEVKLGMAALGIQGELAFIPQSAPLVRGIFAALQFRLPEGLTGADLKARAEATYRDEPFVRLVSDSPRVGAVAGSAFCDLAVAASGGNGAVMTAIDNLGKGMASQAVQCMNLALGLKETTGLLIPGTWPG